MFGRKFCGILAVITSIVILASCTKNSSSLLDYQNILKGVSADWEYGLTSYTADITFDGDVPEDSSVRRGATVTFTSPEELTGLTVKYTADSTEASVGKVTLDLPENTGNELYLLVRLFSLYSEELAEDRDGHAKFRGVINGTETEFDVTYKDGVPLSADIIWNGGEIKVTSITTKQ